MIEDDDRDLDGQYRDRLRSTLQTMVSEDATPKHQRVTRPAIILAVSALAAAAIITVALPMMSHRADASLEVACLARADHVTVDDAAAARTVTLSPTPDQVTPQDVETACRVLWANGTLHQASVDFQSGPQSSRAPDVEDLELAVCLLPDGRAGVIPGRESTCAALGMGLWRYEP